MDNLELKQLVEGFVDAKLQVLQQPIRTELVWNIRDFNRIKDKGNIIDDYNVILNNINYQYNGTVPIYY